MTNGVQTVITRAPDGSWQEVSFVAAVAQEQANRLACRWQQNAFYWVEMGELYLVPALMDEVRAINLGEIKDFFYNE